MAVGLMLGALALLGLVLLLLNSSGDISEPGPFEAHAVAALPGGGVAVAGTAGPCGDLVLLRLGPGGERREARVEGDDLGADCASEIVSVTVTRQGIDVLAKLKDETRGLLESDVLTPRGLARFELDGELDEDFGDSGAVDDVAPAVATAPDGSLASADGERFSPDGSELPRRTPPLDLVPGEQEVAFVPAGRLLVAGPPRLGGARDRLLVARLTVRGHLDRSFGSEGLVALPFGPPLTLAPLAGGATLVGDIYGSFVRLDGRGRPDLSYGRRGVATVRDGRLAAELTVGAQGQLGLLRDRPGRAVIRRLSADGRPDRRFVPPPLPAPTGQAADHAIADLAFDRAGRLLVVRDVTREGEAGSPVAPTLIAVDPAGRRVPPLAGGPLTLRLD